MTSVDRREIYRYLGCGRREPAESVKAEVERCLALLEDRVERRSVSRSFPLIPEGEETLSFAGLTVKSRSLSRNLMGCTRILLFAATLGLEPDRLIRRAEIGRISEAAVLQAASAALIEAYCDRLALEVSREAAAHGLYCRPRFSPGYGDFPLALQKDILQLLQAGREIGITLTEGNLMLPTKSVTAVIGLSPVNTRCVLSGCENCDRRDCGFRRD